MGTRRERILQKINPNLLKMTPKLSGDTGSVIDLDSDDSLEDGAKKLKMRFFRNQDLCEKNKRNLAEETVLTVSMTKYNSNNEICEIVSQNLTLPFGGNDDDVSERPGRRLQDLKMELQEKMSAKWLEEYNKRVSENKSLTETKHKRKKKHSKKLENEEIEEEEEYDDANDADVEYEEDEESENEKDYEEIENEKEKEDEKAEGDGSSVAGDEEMNEDVCKEKLEENLEKGDEDDEGGECSLVPAYQPGGGMLYGGSELTQHDDNLPQNLLSPSLRFTQSDSFGSKISEDDNDQTPKKSDPGPSEGYTFPEKVKLFSQNTNDFDLNDAFEFCSGKFPENSQAGVGVESNNEEEEDNQFESAIEEESDDDEAQDVESEKKTKRKNIIAFEDSEAEEEKETENGLQFDEGEDSRPAHLKLLSDDEDENAAEDKTEVKKKTRKNLQFSDEEDAAAEEQEDSDDAGGEGNDDEDELENADDCDQRSVHYDSEENEIINPKEFFEKEAELSGSEWSGDEDERGLDEFDVEEGDADKLDEDQVRSQLERIHVRRVMDDDAREVRLLQEILFEDGDLYTDGKVRERKFKWKNLGGFGDQENEGPKENGGNSSEDEGAEEDEMRKIRHEKELFLMEKTAKKNNEDLSSDEEIVENFHTIKVTSIKTSIKQTGSGEGKTENSKAVAGYTEVAKTTKLSTARGSFLTRNEEFLSRLAKATSAVTDNVLGPKNSKNFVFVSRSPEKIEPEKSTACKRQIEESCSRREKKIKLLPAEIDTGPSILDLLV